jgi:Predicted membrane-associated Zn-dependent proteases 1
MILFAWGDTYASFKDIKTGMVYSEVVKEAGFQDGDIIMNADGKELKMHFDKTLDMNALITFMNAKEVVVKRNGELKTIVMPEGIGDKVLASKRMAYEVNIPSVADSIIAGSQAEKAGLIRGDSIVGIDGKQVRSFADVYVTVGESLGKDVSVAYYRGDSLYNTTAYVDSVNKLGIAPLPTSSFMTINRDDIGFFASFPAGITLAKETLQGYIGQFRYVFTKDGISNLGGFGAIGGLFPATWDWQAFWMMTAFLSVILAVMNILPIPLLDGGHVMFLLYEMITRRKPNEKFMEYATIVGMVLIFGLVIYANGNDIFKAFFK